MKSIYAFIFIVLSALVASAGPIDDAKALYRAGKYKEAVNKLTAIVKSSPNNGQAQYYLGMSYLKLGDEKNALTALQKAEDKGVVDAAQQMAMLAVNEYRMAAADRHIETWEKLAKKEKKNVSGEISQLRSRMVDIENMLQRVERIAIIDSLVVDSVDFFRHYRLSDEAGFILQGAFLLPGYSDFTPKMVFQPQSQREILWGQKGDKGYTEIVSAEILDDGSVQSPQPLGDVLREHGDSDFPYVTSDGITFYYANNGDNSIGGYDIFMSRRQPDGSVLQPQNIGMPYNSPYDDYMLVIDEGAGLGWWATNRNQIPGKVTIYTFVPNESRVNYSANDPHISDYAFVRNIRATQPEGLDIEALKSNPKLHSSKGDNDADTQFQLSLGNGKIYTNYSQFTNSEARYMMQKYVTKCNELNNMKMKLQAMRKGYVNGDKDIAPEIKSLEKRILATEPILKDMRNEVISLERGLKTTKSKGKKKK